MLKLHYQALWGKYVIKLGIVLWKLAGKPQDVSLCLLVLYFQVRLVQ